MGTLYARVGGQWRAIAGGAGGVASGASIFGAITCPPSLSQWGSNVAVNVAPGSTNVTVTCMVTSHIQCFSDATVGPVVHQLQLSTDGGATWNAGTMVETNPLGQSGTPIINRASIINSYSWVIAAVTQTPLLRMMIMDSVHATARAVTNALTLTWWVSAATGLLDAPIRLRKAALNGGTIAGSGSRVTTAALALPPGTHDLTYMAMCVSTAPVRVSATIVAGGVDQFSGYFVGNVLAGGNYVCSVVLRLPVTISADTSYTVRIDNGTATAVDTYNDPKNHEFYAIQAAEGLAPAQNVPLGKVGFASITAGQGPFTTEANISGLQVTFPGIVGRLYRLTGLVRYTENVAGDRVVLRAYNDGAQVGVSDQEATVLSSPQIWLSTVFGTTTASHTAHLTLQRNVGTGVLNVNAATNGPSYILVEDIGPA